MAGVRSGARGFAYLVLVLGGCGREAVAPATICDEWTPGDVVITEVHANPDGSDGDREYVELFNASGALLSLDGLTLVASRSDGASPKTHRFIGTSIDAGSYLVIGNAPIDSLPEHVDYSYGNALGNLRNSDAILLVRCGEMLIDEVSYERTVDGRALELDGGQPPHHGLNDEANHWCASSGTPGAANNPCEVVRLAGTCVEGGAGRAIRSPAAGGVRITEWMANPEGADADFEWVEALFEAEVDLNGFQLGPAPDALKAVVDQEPCFPVGAGARVVFGASPAAAPRVDADLGFSLGNSDARSIVVGADGVVLHRVDYEGTVEGTAWQVDPNGEVCLALREDEYIAGNFGTPGQANPTCPPVLGPGMCFDHGAPRAIRSPGKGGAQITEWMANPSSVGNREGEWVEVRFDDAVDLNGLVLSDLTSKPTTIEDEDCLPVQAGTHVVFARNLNPAENGGIEGVDAELLLSLNNSDEVITLSVDNQVLDSVTYEESKAGVATQVDEDGNVCDAVHEYGDGDVGTPGSANPWCF